MNDLFFILFFGGRGHKIVNMCALKIYQNLNVKSQVTTEGRQKVNDIMYTKL